MTSALILLRWTIWSINVLLPHKEAVHWIKTNSIILLFTITTNNNIIIRSDIEFWYSYFMKIVMYDWNDVSLYFLSLINNSPSFITSTSNDHKNYYFVAFESLCRFKEIGHSIISFDRGIIMLPATHKYDGYKNINWLKCFISWQPQANQPFTNSSFDVYCQVFCHT